MQLLYLPSYVLLRARKKCAFGVQSFKKRSEWWNKQTEFEETI